MQIAQPDVWSKYVAQWKDLPDTPSIQTAKSITETANKCVPFAQATKILDIGCGAGDTVAELIASYGSQLPATSQIIASDISPGVVRQVQERKEKVAGWERVLPAILDATNLSTVEDKSISHVLSSFALFFMPQEGWKEAFRVLEEGGVLVTSSMADPPWVTVMQTALSQIRPEKRVPTVDLKSRSVEGLKATIEEAGFKDVEAYKVELYLRFESPEEIIDLELRSMPFVAMVTSDMSEEEVSKWRELMVKEVREKYPEGQMVASGFIGSGRK
jgi:ubiquinone/menaquinone biosynthesis C-methylase UbiE